MWQLYALLEFELVDIELSDSDCEDSLEGLEELDELEELEELLIEIELSETLIELSELLLLLNSVIMNAANNSAWKVQVVPLGTVMRNSPEPA